MKLQLHIGTHKTGTTAIQSYLYAHRKQLKKLGVLYPKCCDDVCDQQFSFIATCMRNNEDHSAQQYIDKIRQEAIECDAQIVVISGEDFSLLDKDKIELLANMLDDFEVEIVVYFRNIYDHLISTFAQINRLCAVLPAWDHIGSTLHDLMDYDALLVKWCDAFGSERLKAHSYDQHKSDLILHFIENLNITADKNRSLLKTVDAPRFTNSNAKFDPVFELFLMLIGHSTSSRDFNRARDLYKKRFGDNEFTRDTQLLLARAFLQSRKLKFNHPKLKSFKKDLKPALAVTQNTVNTDVGEFMIALGGVITDLGHAKVHDDYRIVKAWRQWLFKTKLKIKRLLRRWK